MNNLPKHHGAGLPEAQGPVQLHRLKAGPAGSFVWGATTPKPPMATRLSSEQLNNDGTLEIAHEICD